MIAAVRTAFGALAVLVSLAVLAAVPGLGFLALGVMLDLEGRIARGERTRDAIPWIDVAPRVVLAIGLVWAWMLPLRGIASALADAQVIDPTSVATHRLAIARAIFGALIAAHVFVAIVRGGAPSRFFRPIDNLRWLARDRTSAPIWPRIQASIASLAIGRHLGLGVRGFAVAFAWLVIPSLLLVAGEGGRPFAPLFAWTGGIAMLAVLGWLPFAQARFAAEDRVRAAFELRAIRVITHAAPFARLVATLALIVLTLPLYLATIFLTPADAAWLVCPVFVAGVVPARAIVGWAYSRGVTRDRPAPRGIRYVCSVALVLLLALYVFALFATQLVGARGTAVLFAHPAFLLPRPP